MAIVVWGIGGFWAMEANAMACGPLVLLSKDGDRQFHPHPVLQLYLNTVDEALWSIMAMWTRWRSYHAMATLCGIIPTCFWVFLLSTGSIHTHHCCNSMPCMNWNVTEWQTCFLDTSLKSLTGWYCTLPHQWSIPAISFGSSAPTE